ncbi:MAG: hypothetical protein Q9196_006292 [Gyalolechia fulgens]
MSYQLTIDGIARVQMSPQYSHNALIQPHHQPSWNCPDRPQPNHTGNDWLTFHCEHCKMYCVSLRERSDILRHRIRELEGDRACDKAEMERIRAEMEGDILRLKKSLAARDASFLDIKKSNQELQRRLSAWDAALKSAEQRVMGLKATARSAEEGKQSAQRETSKWREFTQSLQKQELPVREQ